MKNSPVAGLCLLFIALASCRRDDPMTMQELTKEKIVGKWQFQRGTDEYYQPMDVLISNDEETGTPADSVIFKNDNLVYLYKSGPNGPIEDINEYNIVNDSTINIDDELYKIRKLTNTELYVYQEEIDAGKNEKNIRRGYYIR